MNYLIFEKKNLNKLLKLQILNVLVFIVGFFSFEIILFSMGYSRFIFASYDTIPKYEHGLFFSLFNDIEPFAFIVTVLIFLINVFLFFKIKKNNLWRNIILFDLLNILFIIFGILKVLSGFISFITSDGYLS